MNNYIVTFFIFSFLGWIWESIYCTLKQKKWANRGFLFGPICPIYGFGGILALGIYELINLKYLPNLEIKHIFIFGIIISMFLEYPTSFLLEKFFKARWWDYSDIPLNINGRISVPTSIGFGVASILIFKFLIPFFQGYIILIPNIILNILSLILVAGISSDITLTVSGLSDFQKRINTFDDNFQSHMTEVIEHFYETQSYFQRKAVKRIVKISRAKEKISKKLKNLKDNI